ncbi:hypothetical protein SY2F82_77740 [Streptomyces sp. Y2F8-2]|nr:hypothetical protein SY2F82_77740 [Streptomyces sp. Y2F8-2]
MYRDMFSFAQASFAQASILLMGQVRKGGRRMEMPRGSWEKRGGRALRRTVTDMVALRAVAAA